jgi:hypothetical protein
MLDGHDIVHREAAPRFKVITRVIGFNLQWGSSAGMMVGRHAPLRLCRDPVVAVMRAADFWNGDNATG